MKKPFIPVEHHATLAKLYFETGIPLDRLPYTQEFEQLHCKFCAQSHYGASLNQLWEQLVSLRKRYQLAKIRKRRDAV